MERRRHFPPFIGGHKQQKQKKSHCQWSLLRCCIQTRSTLQKKRKSDKQFVIASAGRVGTKGKSQALHANLADSNSKDALNSHYKELIDKGLDAEKVELVVTDMLPAYQDVITANFPNAVQQYCIFHFIQAFNKHLKAALKDHRTTAFEEGDRKEAHLISFLLLKGEEKLTGSERETARIFCELHPDIAAAYSLKESIRTLYAEVQTIEQALAYKDIIIETFTAKISQTMQKGLSFFEANFEKTISYLRKGFFRDRTNNDAERMMRQIKRTQQTHFFLRKSENYIKKIRIVLGIDKPIAT